MNMKIAGLALLAAAFTGPARADSFPDPSNGRSPGYVTECVVGGIAKPNTVANGCPVAPVQDSTTNTNTGATATSAASIDSKLTTSNTNTGATATSAASMDAKLTTSNTNTGATATSAASIDTKLTTSNTNTGASATSAASIDSKLTTSNTNTGATATSAAAGAASLASLDAKKGASLSVSDASSTVATGGTSQTGLSTNSGRKGCLLQNPSSATFQGVTTAESLFVNLTASASSAGGSYEILPGGQFGCDLAVIGLWKGALNVTAPTAGHKYTLKEFN